MYVITPFYLSFFYYLDLRKKPWLLNWGWSNQLWLQRLQQLPPFLYLWHKWHHPQKFPILLCAAVLNPSTLDSMMSRSLATSTASMEMNINFHHNKFICHTRSNMKSNSRPLLLKILLHWTGLLLQVTIHTYKIVSYKQNTTSGYIPGTKLYISDFISSLLQKLTWTNCLNWLVWMSQHCWNCSLSLKQPQICCKTYLHQSVIGKLLEVAMSTYHLHIIGKKHAVISVIVLSCRRIRIRAVSQNSSRGRSNINPE